MKDFLSILANSESEKISDQSVTDSGFGQEFGTAREENSDSRIWLQLIGAEYTAAYDLALDPYGNVYITGSTDGNLGGQRKVGMWDAFVAKYDPHGDRLWTRLLGTQSSCTYARGITCDSDGNVYIAGNTEGALGGQAPYGINDCFLSKLSPEGEILWTKQFGSRGEDTNGNSIFCDKTGNLYVAGSTTGTLFHENPKGRKDAFLAKLDTEGNFLWLRMFGEKDAAVDGSSLGCDSYGNIYLTGYSDSGIQGTKKTGKADSFLVRFDPNGIQQWVQIIGSENAITEANALCSDALGNIYVSGVFMHELEGAQGEMRQSLFLVKFESDGLRQWLQVHSSEDSDFTSHGIGCDAFGNLYIAGYTNAEIGDQSKIGKYDHVLIKYDSSGTLKWSKLLGSENRITYAYGVVSDFFGNIYTTGSTDGALNGEPTTGAYDLFVNRFDSRGQLCWTRLLGVASKLTSEFGLTSVSGGDTFPVMENYAGSLSPVSDSMEG